MKTNTFLFISLFLCSAVFGQPETIKSKYAITRKAFQITEDGRRVIIGVQSLNGVYLKKGNAYLFYAMPSSQNDIIINKQAQEFRQSTVSFPNDSFQMVAYRNVDSLYNLVYLNRNGQGLVNKFDLIIGEQKWEIQPETKKIGGFLCQKAIWKDDGDMVAEIWFAPDISVYYALQSFNGVPGFVVEATQFYPYTEFKLTEYVADTEVKEEEILPDYLRKKRTYLSRELYEQNKKQLRILRKTQGRLQ